MQCPTTQRLRSRLHHSRLRPIETTSLLNPTPETFEEHLGRPSFIDTDICNSQGSPGFTSSLVQSLPVVCFHTSSYNDSLCKLFHRTFLRHLRHLSDQDTLCITRPSILSTRIYCWSYLATIDWTMKMYGTTELDGAISLMYVEDGVTSYTPRHIT